MMNERALATEAVCSIENTDTGTDNRIGRFMTRVTERLEDPEMRSTTL